MPRLRRNITAYKRATGKKFDARAELTRRGKKSLADLASETYTIETVSGEKVEIPKYYFHMASTDVTLQKQNVSLFRGYFTTPLGFYAYPLTAPLLQRVLGENAVFYGSHRPYVQIVELTKPEKVLYLDSWMPGGKSGAEVYRKAQPRDLKQADELAFSKVRTALKQLVALQRSMSPEAAVKELRTKHKAKAYRLANWRNWLAQWTNNLKRKGYLAVYDPGNSVIHQSEPSQMVFLSTTAYKVHAILKAKDIRKDRELLTGGLDGSAVRKRFFELAYENRREGKGYKATFKTMPKLIFGGTKNLKLHGGDRNAALTLNFTQPIEGITFTDFTFDECKFRSAMDRVRFEVCQIDATLFAPVVQKGSKVALRDCYFVDSVILFPETTQGSYIDCEFNDCVVKLPAPLNSFKTTDFASSFFRNCDVTPSILLSSESIPFYHTLQDIVSSRATGKGPIFRGCYIYAPAGWSEWEDLYAPGDPDFDPDKDDFLDLEDAYTEYLKTFPTRRGERRALEDATRLLTEYLRYVEKDTKSFRKLNLTRTPRLSNEYLRVVELPWEMWTLYLSAVLSMKEVNTLRVTPPKELFRVTTLNRHIAEANFIDDYGEPDIEGFRKSHKEWLDKRTPDYLTKYRPSRRK